MRDEALSIGIEPGELVRQKLREVIAAYGRSAFEEARRCEAILRDCCPTAPREVFLLVSALRENVAEELVRHEASMPEAALAARLTRRLSDHLGLSEDSARWAVESWRYGLEDNPGLQSGGGGIQFIAQRQESSREVASAGAAVYWPWLGMCFVTLASAVVALAATIWVSFFHLWQTWKGGLIECGLLALALAGAGLAELLAARSFEQMTPPDHRALDPGRAPFALLPEVLILLLLPLVAVAAPVMWVMEWWLQLHAMGLPHGALFHVIRSIESLWVGTFLYFWIRTMIGIQGRIACSMLRQR